MSYPVLCFWKYKPTGGWADKLSGWLIYFFQKIKLKKTYTVNSEKQLDEIANIIHVGIYFPETNKTYDMWQTTKVVVDVV